MKDFLLQGWLNGLAALFSLLFSTYSAFAGQLLLRWGKLWGERWGDRKGGNKLWVYTYRGVE